MPFPSVLSAYGFNENDCTLINFGSGLINNTWLLVCGNSRYILQRINDRVFHRPQDIAENIDRIGEYLQSTAPFYLFVHPLRTTAGEPIVHDGDNGYFRIFPFIQGSQTVDVVDSPAQAFEAAAQFGRFTALLNEFDASALHTTIPHFHNLELRHQQFKDAVQKTQGPRKQQALSLIDYVLSQSHLVDKYNELVHHPGFKTRVMHHDTKISNVLFDQYGKGLCVIDLDTVMPGLFISDVGDMMRTYLSPVSEEERDVSQIAVRDDYFLAIVRGYLSEMSNELTEAEKHAFVYAGQFMIYMQALRFLTDYLNDDVYYGQHYEGHNLARAMNQATLLRALTDKEERLQEQALQLAFSGTAIME